MMPQQFAVTAPTRMKPARFAHAPKKIAFFPSFLGFALAFPNCVRYSSNRPEFFIEK